MNFSIRLLAVVGSLVTIGALAHAKVGHPTMYSTYYVDSTKMTCTEEDKQTLINDENEVLASLCQKQYRHCLLNGACVVLQADGTRETFSYTRFNESLQRQTFRKMTGGCLYGQGSSVDAQNRRVKTCLDPYFSISADLAEHKIGEVIFVPKLVGLKLPTGETHNGYVVVRDSSEDTSDRGFDYYSFFTGLESAEDQSNPFLRLILDNIDYVFDYKTVDESTAAKVRKERNFPNLPKQIQEFYK